MKLGRSSRMGIAAAMVAGAVIALSPAASAATPTPRAAPHIAVRQTMHAHGWTIVSVAIPVSTLSGPLRARLAAQGVGPNDTATGYLLRNDADGLCLDANNAGPTAGQNGDKVQLWTCFDNPTGHTNQYWIPFELSDRYDLVYNYQYQSKVLDANDVGGLANGHIVQLWDWLNGPNQIWDFDDWLLRGASTYLHMSYYNFVLDATSQHLGNGDQMQIYQPLDRPNQLWF